ncbi:MAG: hypothetical protein WCC64_12785, partial [Aliidongia sp.]
KSDGTLSHNKLVGEGLIPKTDSWAYLLNWAREKARRSPTVMIFENTSMAKLADEARGYGLHVIGNGSFCHKLEEKRLWGFKVAEEAGATLPPYEAFSTITDAMKFAGTLGDTATFWKTDQYLDADSTHGASNGEEMVAYLAGVRVAYGDRMSCIIQKKMEGVPISTARWWNGRSWSGPWTGDIEHKKAWNDELGPSTGCSFDAVWFYDDEPAIAKALGWDGLAEQFVKYEAPPGIYDMNAIAGEDGNAYFLEWTPRFGWDCTVTSFELLKGELGKFFWSLVTGTANGPDVTSELAYSIRLGVPPYPWEHWSPMQGDKHMFKAMPLYSLDLDDDKFIPYQLSRDDEIGLSIGSPDGLLGLAVGKGRRLSAIHDDLVEWIQDHKSGIPGLSARTDGAKVVAKDAKAINDVGAFTVPEGLTK